MGNSNLLKFFVERRNVFDLKKNQKLSKCLSFHSFRAKSYSMVTLKDQKMAVAGVKRSKRHCLKHVDFVDVIASASLKTITQRTLTSKEHRIFMQESNRIALSYFDIKRFVLGNGIDTVPYGYRAFE